jgi:hypothetical protein
MLKAFTQYYDFDISDKSFSNEVKIIFRNNDFYIRDKFAMTLDELKSLITDNNSIINTNLDIVNSPEYKALDKLMQNVPIYTDRDFSLKY